jgi:hypothetical protein
VHPHWSAWANLQFCASLTPFLPQRYVAYTRAPLGCPRTVMIHTQALGAFDRTVLARLGTVKRVFLCRSILYGAFVCFCMALLYGRAGRLTT